MPVACAFSSYDDRPPVVNLPAGGLPYGNPPDVEGSGARVRQRRSEIVPRRRRALLLTGGTTAWYTQSGTVRPDRQVPI